METPKKSSSIIALPHSVLSDTPAVIDLRYFFNTLYRYKWLILGMFVICTLTAALITRSVPPLYTAQTSVQVEGQRHGLSEIDALFMQRNIDLRSEIERLESRELARQIIDRFDLARTMMPTKTGVFSHLTDLLTATAPDALSSEERHYMTITDTFLRRLDVMPVPQSRVIRIRYSDHDPARAAAIANAIAAQYLDNQVVEKLNHLRTTNDWVNRQLADLREAVRVAEEAADLYRRSRPDGIAHNTELVAEQMSQLSLQLVTARADLATTRARLEEIYSKMAAHDLASISEVLTSPLITQLKLEETRAQQKVSELASRYGERHPRMIHARAELNALREKIRDESITLINAMEGDARVADVRALSLEKDLAALQDQTSALGASTLRMMDLERDVLIARTLFDTFLEKYKTAETHNALPQADARWLTKATAPVRPAFPNTKLILSVTGFLSLILGITLAFLINILDSRFKSIQHVIDHTGLPVLGLVPALPRASKGSVADYVLRHPLSSVAESVRMILASVRLLHTGDAAHPQKVINVTSSISGEGKTTLALWLGRMAAQSGQKVVIVDCDVRAPSLHHIFPDQAGLTLADFMADPDALLKRREMLAGREFPLGVDPLSGLHLIFANADKTSTIHFINSPRMEALVQALRQTYDLVILDSPPSLGISDGRQLARLADATLYVVKYDAVARDAAQAGLRNYRDFGLPLAGVVLSFIHAGIGANTEYLYKPTPAPSARQAA